MPTMSCHGHFDNVVTSLLPPHELTRMSHYRRKSREILSGFVTALRPYERTDNNLRATFCGYFLVRNCVKISGCVDELVGSAPLN